MLITCRYHPNYLLCPLKTKTYRVREQNLLITFVYSSVWNKI